MEHECIFHSRTDAEVFLDYVKDMASLYGCITFNDIDDLMHVDHYRKDGSCVGWLKNTVMTLTYQRCPGVDNDFNECYRVVFPTPVEIDMNAQSNDDDSHNVEKRLGKIDFAEFGTMRDYPFLIGLQLGFSMGGCGIMDGGKYTVNISPECRWEGSERLEAVTGSIERVCKILKDAKVNYVSELINKPVEVTIVNGSFKDFRILTEVL